MKKNLIAVLMVVLLSLVWASTASAAYVLYVQKDGTNGYAAMNTDSYVMKVFNAGDQILVEEVSGDGGWVATLVEAPDGDGQEYAWIRMKRLGDTIPQSRCSHDWGAWTVNNEPTCTEPGYKTRYCKICGIMDEANIPANGHSFGQWKVTEQPTCTAEGMQVHECSVCGAVEGVDIPRIDHTYGKWNVRKEATCTAEGEEYSTCTMCGKEQTRVIPKAEHKYGEFKETKKATCTAEGEKVRVCTVCRQEDKQVIPKLPHTFGEWKITKEATCTEKGEREHQCTVCREIEKEEIEMIPHDFEDKIIKEATDHSSGIRSRVCKKCGFKTEEEEFDPEGTLRRGDSGDEVQKMQQLLIDQGFLGEGGADGKFGGGTENALMEFQLSQKLTPDGIGWPQTLKRLNHEFGPWKLTKKLTRTHDGERLRVCKDCNYAQVEAISAEPSYVRRDSGEDVRILQQMLGAVGCDAGDLDGVFGRKMNEAFTKFAEDHDTTFVEDKITPQNVDALVNAWIASVPADSWKGEGQPHGPVSLALTMRPVNDEEAYEEGSETIQGFEWTLKNLGTSSCRMTALLLGTGDTPDFSANNIVLVLSGEKLEADGANSLTGSVLIPSEEEEAAEDLSEDETEDLSEEGTEAAAEVETEAALIEVQEETPMYFMAIVTDDAGAVWTSNVYEFG